MFHVKQSLLIVYLMLLTFLVNAQGSISLEDKVFTYDSKRITKVEEFLNKLRENGNILKINHTEQINFQLRL